MCGDKVKAYLNWPQYLHLVFPLKFIFYVVTNTAHEKETGGSVELNLAHTDWRFLFLPVSTVM